MFAVLFQAQDKHHPLSSITEDVFKTNTLLEDVTREHMESIRILTKCKPLIDWLRENIAGKIFYAFVNP